MKNDKNDFENVGNCQRVEKENLRISIRNDGIRICDFFSQNLRYLGAYVHAK